MKKTIILLTLFYSAFSFSQVYQIDEKTIEAKIFPIDNFKSNCGVYSMFWHEKAKEFIFTSSCKIKKINSEEWTFFGINNIYIAKLLNNEINPYFQISEIDLFSKKIKNGNNTGQMCFSVTGDTAFFCHNEMKKKAYEVIVVNPQIYMIIKKEGKWGKKILLPFNNNKYAFTDPYYDSENKKLYFASDKPNGLGGFDIYYSTLASNWSSVVNLEKINTEKNEKSPFLKGKNIFFASERKTTRGALDIFWTELNSNKKIKNLSPINSMYNDFGLFLFKNKNSGLVLSERNGKPKPFYLDYKFFNIKVNRVRGKIEPLNPNLLITDSVKLSLLNSNKKVAYTVKTDKAGQFLFDEIKYDDKYLVNFYSKQDMKVTLFDKDSSVYRTYLADKNYRFTFVNNPNKKNDILNLLADNLKNEDLKTTSVIGKVVYSNQTLNDIEEISLLDELGKIKFKIKTNEDGFFKFKNIPLNHSYSLMFKGKEKNTKILLCDKNGIVNKILKGNYGGYYIYHKENNNEYSQLKLPIETKIISGKFKYRNLDITVDSLMVLLIDENGDIAFRTTTNANGEFEFKKALLEKNYIIKAFNKKELDLFLTDETGKVTGKLLSNNKNLFTYRQLKNINVGTLSLIPEEQMDLALGTGFVLGQLVYQNEFGRYPNHVTVSLLDSNGVTVQEQLTDKMGNFEFRNLYLKENFLFKSSEINDSLIMLFYDTKDNVLSQLRSDTTGVFKYRNLNSDYTYGLKMIDLDSVQNYELDSKMMFGSFKYRNLKTNFENELTVFIYDEDGILLAVEKTNEKGEFRFRNLPIKNNFHFKLESQGEMLSLDDFTLYINNRFGKKVALLQNGGKGYFKYRPLGMFEFDNLEIIDETSLDFNLDNPTKTLVKVYFKTNKKSVSGKNIILLNEVYKQMKLNSSLKLEVNAYADSRSSDDYNLILSGKRGDWVMKYLVKKGIEASRFIVNAYGEAMLTVECEDCTEADHAKNRRAELRLF